MKKLNPMKDLGTAEGRKAVERWTQDLVRPLEGKVEPREYGDYILPLLALKRISDVFEDEVKRTADTIRGIAVKSPERDARFILRLERRSGELYIPEGRTWEAIGARQEGLGAFMDETVQEIIRASGGTFSKLHRVIDGTDYSALDDQTLKELVEVLSRYRLGLWDVDQRLLEEVHRALRRLNGEDLPPDGLGRLLCGLVSPRLGEWIIASSDHAGAYPGETSGLLGECYRFFLERYGEERNGVRKFPFHLSPGRFFGHEPSSCGFSRGMANALFHGMEALTFVAPYLPGWVKADVAVAYGGLDAPWKRVKELGERLGTWGRMAIALDPDAVHSEEGWGFRKGLVEADRVEAVVSTPVGLMVLLNRKRRHPGEVLLVEAPADLTRADADRITELVRRWDGGNGVGTIVRTEEIAQNGYDLRPGRYVRTSR